MKTPIEGKIMTPRSWAATACGAALSVTLMVGCSPNNQTEGNSGLPPSLADGLNVAMDVSYPPMEYFDNNNIVGVDPDVAQALATQLGVPVKVDNIGFDSLISSLQARRADIIISAMKDTPERRERLNMIDYFKTTLALLVADDNPKNITDLQSLCGLNVGQVTGTQTFDQIEAESQKCPDGKPIGLLGFGSNADINAAIRSGRIDANLEDAVSLNFVAKGGGFGVVAQPQLGDSYFGIATLKSDSEVTDVIRTAFKALVEAGTIQAIYDEYGYEDALSQGFIENQGQ